MKAGRELDALIAEKVMGYVVYGTQYYAEELETNLPDLLPEVPNYSTQIADAWLVVEKMQETWDKIDIQWQAHDGEWVVGWNCDGMFFLDDTFVSAVYADTAPLAICLAALKAVE